MYQSTGSPASSRRARREIRALSYPSVLDLDAVQRPLKQTWPLGQQTPLQHAWPAVQAVVPQHVSPVLTQNGVELVWQQIWSTGTQDVLPQHVLPAATQNGALPVRQQTCRGPQHKPPLPHLVVPFGQVASPA
jgi:hypothetical protein